MRKAPRKKKIARAATKAKRATRSARARREEELFTRVVDIVEEARRRAARAVNAAMTASYWLIGRRIVVEEQRELAVQGTARR